MVFSLCLRCQSVKMGDLYLESTDVPLPKNLARAFPPEELHLSLPLIWMTPSWISQRNPTGREGVYFRMWEDSIIEGQKLGGHGVKSRVLFLLSVIHRVARAGSLLVL